MTSLNKQEQKKTPSRKLCLKKEKYLLKLFNSVNFDKLSDRGDLIKSDESSSSIIFLNELRVMSIGRFGLISNDVRQKVWPLVANSYSTINDSNSQSFHVPKLDINKLEAYKDYQQVLMDVNRSLKRFPPGMDEVERMSMQDQLVSLIVRVLYSNKQLHYYQGYHDIAVTFLLVLGEDVAANVLSIISEHHLKDFMGPNMDPTIRILHLLPALLRKERPALADSLSEIGLEPFYALPWVITWFGHVLGDLSRILRLYDFFLSSHPLMPIYLSAAIVLHRNDELMQMTGSEGADYAQLHHSLSNLPSDLPLEKLILHSVQLFRSHPPVELWKVIPKDEEIVGLRNRSRDKESKTKGNSIHRNVSTSSSSSAALSSTSSHRFYLSKQWIVSGIVLFLALLIALLLTWFNSHY